MSGTIHVSEQSHHTPPQHVPQGRPGPASASSLPAFSQFVPLILRVLLHVARQVVAGVVQVHECSIDCVTQSWSAYGSTSEGRCMTPAGAASKEQRLVSSVTSRMRKGTTHQQAHSPTHTANSPPNHDYPSNSSPHPTPHQPPHSAYRHYDKPADPESA